MVFVVFMASPYSATLYPHNPFIQRSRDLQGSGYPPGLRELRMRLVLYATLGRRVARHALRPAVPRSVVVVVP